MRDFPLSTQVIHRLWYDEVWRFGARLGHPFRSGAAYRCFGLVLRFIGQQLGHFNLRQQWALLDRVALIHSKCLQVARNLGVKGGLLIRQDTEGGEGDGAGDLAALRHDCLHRDGGGWLLRSLNRGTTATGKPCKADENGEDGEDRV